LRSGRTSNLTGSMGLDAPALGKSILQFLPRHAPGPLRPWVLIRKAHQEKTTARLEDRRQSLDVAAAVPVRKDVK
jgi:hypothetical protein